MFTVTARFSAAESCQSWQCHAGGETQQTQRSDARTRARRGVRRSGSRETERGKSSAAASPSLSHKRGAVGQWFLRPWVNICFGWKADMRARACTSVCFNGAPQLPPSALELETRTAPRWPSSRNQKLQGRSRHFRRKVFDLRDCRKSTPCCCQMPQYGRCHALR